MTDALRRIYLDLPAGAAWVLSVTAAHIVAYDLQVGPLVQLPTALLFVLTCPGALLMDWAHLPNWPSRLALVVGASLAVNIVIVTLLLTSGTYSAAAGLAVMGFLGMALAFYTTVVQPVAIAGQPHIRAL